MRFLIFLALAFIAETTASQTTSTGPRVVGHPTVGIVYNTKESSSITYSCTREGADLRCEFVQTAVRKKLAQSDVNHKRLELTEQLKRSERDGSVRAQCEQSLGMREKVKRALNDPKLTLIERQAIDLQGAALEKILIIENAARPYCQLQTDKTRENLTEKLVEIDVNTCRISSNRWDEVFQRPPGVSAGNFGDTGVWIRKTETPIGPCSIVPANRWELDKNEASNFWNYVSKKVVLNPAGQSAFGMKCRDLDEAQYEFSWRSQGVPFDLRLKTDPI